VSVLNLKEIYIYNLSPGGLFIIHVVRTQQKIFVRQRSYVGYVVFPKACVNYFAYHKFQCNGVYSKRTDEGLGDCWMRGNQLILI